MSKLIPAYDETRGSGNYPETNGWEAKFGYNYLVHETYIDLEGFNRDGMTCFPESAAIQDPGDYICDNAATRINILDMITTERIPAIQINSWLETDNQVPGMIDTTVDWSQIVWGYWRSMMPQATFQGNAAILLSGNGGTFGSGQATTARKLWVYRFVWLYGSAEGDELVIPASRIILNAVFAQEGEKEFLMRQKRSYELGESY